MSLMGSGSGKGSDAPPAKPLNGHQDAVGTSAGSPTPGVDAFLGKGSKVVGTLTFSGPVEIGGVVEGELNAQDKLTIAEGATVSAKVNGGEILVKGTVNGDITASKRLSLKRPARVTGNITTAVLSIEEGVVFEGKCTMAGSPSSDSKRS